MMAAIRIESFQGMIPKESDRLLPESAAAHAENCRTYSGELVGFNQPKFRYPYANNNAPGVANIAFHIHYKVSGQYTTRWIKSSDNGARVQPSTVINDKYSTHFATVDTGSGSRLVSFRGSEASSLTFDLSDPKNEVDLPTLGDVITKTVSTGAGVQNGRQLNRAYVVTLLNTETGAESPPSNPVLVSLTEGQIVGLTIDNIPAKYRSTAWRVVLYRSVSGQISTSLFRVTKVFHIDGTPNTSDEPKPIQVPPASTPAVIQDKWPNSTALGVYSDEFVSGNTILQTSNWLSPKDRELKGLCTMAGGFMAAFSDNKLYFSVPFRPYSWPDNFSISVDDDIVAIESLNQSIAVMTRSHTYIASGSTPASVTLNKLPKIEPCISPNAVADTELGVVYVSREGLILVNTSGSTNLTKDAFTTHEWSKYIEKEPGYEYTCAMDDYLFILFTGPNTGFCIDVRDPRQWFSELTNFDNVYHLEIDKNTGLSVMAGPRGVYTWDTPKYRPSRFKWRSKKFSLPTPVNFGALRLEMDKTIGALYESRDKGYNDTTIGSNMLGSVWSRGAPQSGTTEAELSGEITIKVWADDRLVGTFNVTKERMVRLPSGFKAVTWQFEVDSYSRVYSIHVAETSKGLVQV